MRLRLLPLLALASALAGCAASSSSSNTTSTLPLVAAAPTVTRSPTVFVMGDSTTQTLPSGQIVALQAGGPSLSNPVKGQPVQFAPLLVETFTMTAHVLSGTPVTFTPDSFAIRRVVGGDTTPRGPSSVVVAPGETKTWSLATTQTPGEGYLVWRTGSVSWSFVAEND